MVSMRAMPVEIRSVDASRSKDSGAKVDTLMPCCEMTSGNSFSLNAEPRYFMMRTVRIDTRSASRCWKSTTQSTMNCMNA